MITISRFRPVVLIVALLLMFSGLQAQPVTPGAHRVKVYVPMLKNKRVGVFANHTSMVGNTHLVDTLRKLGVNITVIFGPEHGFGVPPMPVKK